MKTILHTLAAALLLFAATAEGFAQDQPCATDEMVRKSLEAHPEFLNDYQQEQDRLNQIDQEAYARGYKQDERAAMVVYTIPIVFHIINEGGTENISDAQVYDAVRILNEDYRKLNADFANTVSAFTSIAADCEIQFRLAQKDPNGLCTNGIDRVYSSLTNAADDGSKLDPWPRNKYLNVWVVKTIGTAGVAGYAYLPGTSAASTDGVLILSSYIGSIGTGTPIRSHALTHEIGHFLNLKHCWGNTNNPGVDCSGTDNVSDTPPTMGWTSCNLSGATCGSPLDNVQNFMEYSYCSTMFTAGQKTRMVAALNSATGQRSSLWTTTNLSVTGVSLPAVLCTANFESNIPSNTICAGTSLTFSDLSWNGTPTSWSWTFAGGTPSTSTSSSPTIVYNTPGTYDVTLTVSNASGSVSATKTGYVRVNPSTAMYSNPVYTEGFEGSPVPNADWQVINGNAGSNTWEQTTVAAATGTHCVRLVNSSSYDGYEDDLIGPSIDMTAVTGTAPTMTFKVAHAQKTSSSADKLQVLVSTNCGQSWTLRKNLSGASLSTAGVVSSSFVPSASQWVTQSVNLSGYATQPDLFYKFVFTSNAGNNIYIDDINISATPDGVDELENNINFNVYPNPSENTAFVSFDLISKENVTVKLFDLVGRKLVDVLDTSLNEGEYQYEISNNDKLAPGVYFVTLTAGSHSFTKKLIVK